MNCTSNDSLEFLRAELARLRAELAALQMKTPVVRLTGQVSVRVGNPRLTYTFDPNIPGDFVRAVALARENCGDVRDIRG